MQPLPYSGFRGIDQDFHTALIPELKLTTRVGTGIHNSSKSDVELTSWLLFFYFSDIHMNGDNLELYSANINKLKKIMEAPSLVTLYHGQLIELLQGQLGEYKNGVLKPVSREFFVLAQKSVPIIQYVGEYDCWDKVKYLNPENLHHIRNDIVLAASVILLLVGFQSKTVKSGFRFSLDALLKSKKYLQVTKGDGAAKKAIKNAIIDVINSASGDIDVFNLIDVAAEVFEKSKKRLNTNNMNNKTKFLALTGIAAMGGIAFGTYEYKNYQTCKANLDETVLKLNGTLEQLEEALEYRGKADKIDKLEEENLELKQRIDKIEKEIHQQGALLQNKFSNLARVSLHNKKALLQHYGGNV